ncbi:hypothetical protein N7447_009379 [Penicillium robsamsonii]|uniref:uncharacterized protein n=1 Tax=Penicillium robsamsonii TaxID=1792511 RepID=UPI002546FD8D|nr:uncharacterized protein N7447_009379 [Penicillium robsamsonii]KAJ5817146.1 hypothetical protein N7447_009379 [Penicillium robsamsonii]
MGASSQSALGLATTESAFIQLCVDFAISRINLERKNFQREAVKCISSLTENTPNIAQELVKWLHIAVNHSHNIGLCNFPYENRNCIHIDQLAAMALQEENKLDAVGRWSCFSLVRHHISVLAHHIRAPKELVADSFHLGHMLQTYDVYAIDPFPSVPGPVRDSHTNLRGILNRIFKTTGEEKKLVEDGLLYLNKTSFSFTFEQFVKQYEQPCPQVHTEVQVLEHFYQKKLFFADDGGMSIHTRQFNYNVSHGYQFVVLYLVYSLYIHLIR